MIFFDSIVFLLFYGTIGCILLERSEVMIKIEKSEFTEKFTEINIRQRMYNEDSFVTLVINTEFYPSLVGDNLVSGVVEAKIDINNIKSLNDLVGKHYKGDIGSINISVNNDGVWEYQSKDDFEISIINRKGRNLEFELSTDNCVIKTIGTIVSLYTTSSSDEKLNENFDLSDFYKKPIVKNVGNNAVMKYFVKE